MRASIVNHSFGAVFDQELHELERFVDLAPFLSRLLGEALVDHWHDFVKQLAGNGQFEVGGMAVSVLHTSCECRLRSPASC